jgi:hypothetical protein
MIHVFAHAIHVQGVCKRVGVTLVDGKPEASTHKPDKLTLYDRAEVKTCLESYKLYAFLL